MTDIVTIRGEDLTEQMLEDYRPFVKDFEAYRAMIKREQERWGGKIVKIEHIPFPDGRPGIAEKRYYCEEGTDVPDRALYAIPQHVDSL